MANYGRQVILATCRPKVDWVGFCSSTNTVDTKIERLAPATSFRGEARSLLTQASLSGDCYQSVSGGAVGAGWLAAAGLPREILGSGM